MTYKGDLISGLKKNVEDAELHGVQLPLRGPRPGAYRATDGNGSLVLCDAHLDFRRAAGESWRLMGEGFPAALCDDCEDDMERARR